MADLNELNATQAVKVVGADATGTEQAFVQATLNGAQHHNLRDATGTELLGAKPSANSVPVVLATDYTLPIGANTSSSFSPDQSSYVNGTGNLLLDTSNRLETHSTVTSDEGSFRDDFSGSSLTTTLTGTLTFTSGLATVTGSGTAFTTQVKAGIYVKKTADAETLYLQVSSVVSDTSLILGAPYAGTTAATTGVVSNWKTSVTGGSLTVGSSLINLVSNTASGNVVSINKQGDYGPFNAYFKASISQRIANQISIVGMVDNIASIGVGAFFQFDGAVNTTVKCISQSSSNASDIQTTVVTLPSSAVTSFLNTYEVDITNNQVSFLINGKVLATNKDHIPGPYDALQMAANITNSAVVTTTTMAIDYILFANVDQIETTSNFTGEPQRLLLQGTDSTTGLPIDLKLDATGNLIVTSLTGFGAAFSFGDVTLAALTKAFVRRTAYTEQSSDATRSISSSNAADASAGTGARTLRITYYTSTGVGPLTTDVTLNGTTAVATSVSNICYIENMQVLTAGSGITNAGIITLFVNNAGGGGTIGTINAGDKQTFWGHHYVPINKVCKITGISCSHNGTTVGSGAVFTLEATTIGVTNSIAVQVSDFVRLYGQSSTFSRAYQSPILVTGPAKLFLTCTPESSTSVVYRAAIDFFEP